MILIAVTTASCSSGSTRHASVAVGASTSNTATLSASATPGRVQTLRITYRDGSSERDQAMDVSVLLVGPPTSHRPSTWQASFSDECESGAASMTLVNADGRKVVLGDKCSWSDHPAVASPDGRFLAVWQPSDGGASSIHLVDVAGTPTDLGEVPSSTSANYSTTWTDDGRLWFTNDTAKDTGGVWWFQPRAGSSTFLLVRANALVTGVVALPLS